MEEDSIYRIEEKIEKLIEKYKTIKEENEKLKKENAELGNMKRLIEERLSKLLTRIEELEKEI